MPPLISLSILGRIPSMKNSRDVFLNKKTGRRHWVINTKTQKVMKKIADLATTQRIEQWDNKMLPPKTPFGVSITAYINSFTAPDGDGILNTVMDALQDVLYDNDRYCLSQHVERIITDGPECVTIQVYAIGEHDGTTRLTR